MRRKRAPGEEKLPEEVEALKLRLKRFELTHIVEHLGCPVLVGVLEGLER